MRGSCRVKSRLLGKAPQPCRGPAPPPSPASSFVTPPPCPGCLFPEGDYSFSFFFLSPCSFLQSPGCLCSLFITETPVLLLESSPVPSAVGLYCPRLLQTETTPFSEASLYPGQLTVGGEVGPKCDIHLEPVNVTLFGKKGVSADEVQDPQVRSAWIRLGPKRNDNCPYKRSRGI